MRPGSWLSGQKCAAAAALVIVALAGACSSSSHPNAESTSSPSSTTGAATTTSSTDSGTSTTATTTPVTTATTVVPVTTPPTTPPTTSPPNNTGTATRCLTSNLTVSVGSPDGTAGTIYYEIMYRNHGSATCHLVGFPGVSFLDSSGRQIGSPESRQPVHYNTIQIAPGATVYSSLGVTDPGVYNCTGTAPHSVRIYPPNETVPAIVTAPAGLEMCATHTPGYIGPVESQPAG